MQGLRLLLVDDNDLNREIAQDILEEEASGELINVPIAKVEPRSDQPRTYFDEGALQELADSIAQYGLIQPIVVRKLDNGYYQIIAGERRWRASRMAGLIEVPVRVLKADDRRTAELALVENLQREDLNPIEEAKGYKALIEEYGLTQEEAAQSVGRSRPAITNSMRLLSLSEPVMKLVESGKLSAGHARALLPLNDEILQKSVADKVIMIGLSVRKTEQLVSKTIKKLREAELYTPEENTVEVDYIAEAENFLSQKLARKVKFDMGKRGGKIVLEFYGNDDREALIANLARMGATWQEEK